MEALEIDDAFETELASELRLVRDAMLFVASGATRRVVVANLRHGRVLIEPALDIATGVGVGVEILETADPQRVDLAVVAVAEPPIVARDARGPMDSGAPQT